MAPLLLMLLQLLLLLPAHAMTPEQAATITDVHVVYSNHVDIGFDGISPIPGFARNVVNKYLQVYFPRAMETAHNVSRDTQGKQSFQWMTQCWLVSLYLDCPVGMGFKCPTAAQQTAVRTAIRAGTISWHAFPFNGELELFEPDLFNAGIELCHSLDDEFDLPHKATLSQRDVPGMTRSVVPLLSAAGVSAVSVGVNGFSAPPAFPRVSVWRDEASGKEVLLSYHPGGYGGISAEDATWVEGMTHALIPSWQNDNAGPATSEQVLSDLAYMQTQFPNANIYSSSFDAFLPQLQSVRASLPVVTSECGDSWIWGTASDPLKTAQFRAVQRARASCAASCDCDHFSYEYLNFTRLLLKGGEHTDGGDVKLFLQAYVSNTSDYYQWSNAQLAKVRDTSQPSIDMASTWIEQRQWVIRDPLSALPDTHPLARTAREYLKELHPSMPDTSGMQQHALDQGPIAFTSGDKRLSFFLCPHYGFIANLTDNALDLQWSSFDHPLAALVYQTFTEGDFAAFRDVYGSCDAATDCPWAAMDFGKAGLDAAAHPEHQPLLRPTVQSIWSSMSADNTLEVLIQLAFDSSLVLEYGAPESAWVRLVLPPGDTAASFDPTPGREPLGPSIDITVTLYNKTITRMPEALWLSFDPLRPWQNEEEPVATEDDPGWMLEKLGSLVQVADVVLNGSQSLHALWGDAILGYSNNASAGSANERDSRLTRPQLRVSSLDVALVCVSPPAALSPFPALDPSVHDIALDSLSFSLVNNIWGTNYVEWYPFTNVDEEKNIQYRFTLKLVNDTAAAIATERKSSMTDCAPKQSTSKKPRARNPAVALA